MSAGRAIAHGIKTGRTTSDGGPELYGLAISSEARHRVQLTVIVYERHFPAHISD